MGRHVVFRHLQAILLCQILDGLNKSHADVVHQKTDGVAALAAAEAVKKLLGRAHAERRRFFAVKRAQAHEIGPALFERYMTADDLDHVGAGDQFLDERLGNGHRAILTALSLSKPGLPMSSVSRAGEKKPA